VGTEWWKWDGAGNWTPLSVGSDDGDNVITVTLTDNDSLDTDPTDGTLADPGAPGFEHIVVCDFSATPTSGPAPLAVTFSDGSNQDIDEWQWDFDDDGSVDSTAEAPSHTYATPGVYDVSLDVSSLGVSDNETKVGYVTVYTPCVAEFSASPTLGAAPLVVTFTDESTGDVSSWEWDFDDDGSVDSTEANPAYTYPGVGSYTVSLTVSGLGGTDTITKESFVVVEQQEADPIPILSGSGRVLLVAFLAGVALWVIRRAS
jgi:PKD repeat protein